MNTKGEREVIEILIKDIKRKHGTVSRFCNLAGIDYQETRKLFLYARRKITKERLSALNNLRLKLVCTDEVLHSELITKEDRDKMLSLIHEHYGSISKMCDQNQGLPRVSVYQLLEGKRKKKGDLYLRVTTLLGI